MLNTTSGESTVHGPQSTGETATIRIGERTVGAGQPCFIIAEAGVNHNGELALALQLIQAAKAAGADAVKFQSFRAEAVAAEAAPAAAYQRAAIGAGESQRAMLRRLELSERDHEALAAACRQTGIMFLSTPFDAASADLLERLDVPAFKVPSGELTNLPLLSHIAAKRRPLIVSTGMASLEEVRAALACARAAGASELALLHCTSNYPAEPETANLRAMATMAGAFGVPVGYSDHTLGLEVPLAAVARGACILEKHLTLGRSMPGPDHAASCEPEAFAALVRGVRTVERALGHGRKEPAPSEAAVARVARRSLVAAVAIPAGSRVDRSQLTAKRPGTGVPPAELERVVGRIASLDIPADAVLTWDMFQ